MHGDNVNNLHYSVIYYSHNLAEYNLQNMYYIWENFGEVKHWRMD